MNKQYSIGIDIGGTHTDAVIINDQLEIIASHKTETTIPLELGVKKGLETVLTLSKVESKFITGVFIGTTHATNAILEANDLFRVGVIRIAGHYPESLSPCFGWPERLKQEVFVGAEAISGGYECDLRHITAFSSSEVVEAAEILIAKGMESVAIIGVFSPIAKEQEIQCQEIIQSIAGENFPISLSHQIGGVGFIERENATILNAALKKPMAQGFNNIVSVKDAVGIHAPLFVTQNDGSLIDITEAIQYPLLTISSGPTNSFIGACKLAKTEHAIIVDVGGTSTDIGMIKNGYPRRSMHNAMIGGVSLNFRMPDVLALAIGGGSYISHDQNKNFIVGPKSCGKALYKTSQAFGGESLTMTDIACFLGKLNIPAAKISQVNTTQSQAEEIMKDTENRIANAITLMRGEKEHLPVIAVGGGAKIASSLATIMPDNYSVANAYGAALAEVSATVDTVVSLNSRESTLEKLKEQALSEAIARGAVEKRTRIVDLQVIPYHYVPNQLARVVVTASGMR